MYTRSNRLKRDQQHSNIKMRGDKVTTIRGNGWRSKLTSLSINTFSIKCVSTNNISSAYFTLVNTQNQNTHGRKSNLRMLAQYLICFKRTNYRMIYSQNVFPKSVVLQLKLWLHLKNDLLPLGLEPRPNIKSWAMQIVI